MRDIYTRSFGKNIRYTPPPGYVGNAFSDTDDVKHHIPNDDIGEGRGGRSEDSANGYEADDIENGALPEIIPEPPGESGTRSEFDRQRLSEFISGFAGKIGSEELLLLFVMFLVASEGIGIEFMLLALILIAG